MHINNGRHDGLGAIAQNLHEEPGVFLLLVAESTRLETAVCRRHAQSSHSRLAVGGVEVEHHLRVVVLVVVAVGALAEAFDHRLHAATRTAHACACITAGNCTALTKRHEQQHNSVYE